jgi:hypothetical protein
LTFTLSASDPSSADQAAGFTFAIDWGDGSPVQVAGPTPGNGAGTAVGHIFPAAGSVTPHVQATDKDGGVGVSTPAAPLTVSPALIVEHTSHVTITSLQVTKVKISAKHHAKKALVLAVGFSGALDATAAQTLAAYTVFSGKIKKIHKIPQVIFNKLVPLTQAMYISASDSVVLLPRGKRKLSKFEQLQVNVSVLTDPMGQPINDGRNFTATLTRTGLVLSTTGSVAAM